MIAFEEMQAQSKGIDVYIFLEGNPGEYTELLLFALLFDSDAGLCFFQKTAELISWVSMKYADTILQKVFTVPSHYFYTRIY